MAKIPEAIKEVMEKLENLKWKRKIPELRLVFKRGAKDGKISSRIRLALKCIILMNQYGFIQLDLTRLLDLSTVHDSRGWGKNNNSRTVHFKIPAYKNKEWEEFLSLFEENVLPGLESMKIANA